MVWTCGKIQPKLPKLWKLYTPPKYVPEIWQINSWLLYVYQHKKLRQIFYFFWKNHVNTYYTTYIKNSDIIPIQKICASLKKCTGKPFFRQYLDAFALDLMDMIGIGHCVSVIYLQTHRFSAYRFAFWTGKKHWKMCWKIWRNN